MLVLELELELMLELELHVPVQCTVELGTSFFKITRLIRLILK